MLNISKEKVSHKRDWSVFRTLNYVENKRTRRTAVRLLKWMAFLLFIAMLLPWTQNVRTYGKVSTVHPDERPQYVHSIIAGRIDQWFVREGQKVRKGDTLLVISEIKDAYMDDRLLERTRAQIELKKNVVGAYEQKEGVQERQLQTLMELQVLKLDQARIRLDQAELKAQNDSAKLEAAIVDRKTAEQRYSRMDSLYQKGLKSLVDLESRSLILQKARASETEARNTWMNAKSELIRLQVELAGIRMEYDNTYSKVLSEKLTTGSNRLDAEGQVNKMENMFANYSTRRGYYVILAPQDGYITETFVTGIGETIKEGQAVLSIMPSTYELAAEIFVDPNDLPLMRVGQEVRLQFDGWPSIVFSGWPNASYGTFGGTIYAVDQYAGSNGKFRVLVKRESGHQEWPSALRYGGGVKAMILLKDVPVWYELWRKINGFPPEYYQFNNTLSNGKK